MSFFDWFKTEPKPTHHKIGRGVVHIETNEGKSYQITIRGSASQFDGSVYAMQAENVYRFNYRETRKRFLTLSDGIDIPICNIKKMWFENTEPDFSIPTEEVGY